jgi:hypothetical protein
MLHHYIGMNSYKEKMPNRGMGPEMGGREDDEKPQHVNVPEIGIDPQIPGPSAEGLRNKL